MHHDKPPAYTEEAPAAASLVAPALGRPSSSHSTTLSIPTASISLSSTTTTGTLPKGGDNSSAFAMLSLAESDKLRFIRFPDDLIMLASEVITGLWPKGIQKTQSFDETVQFKLKGNPMRYGMDGEKAAIRVTIMGLLNAFAREGWVVLPAGRVGRMGRGDGQYGQGNSLVFHRQDPQSRSWLCVSFDSCDLLHLLNAPAELATSLLASFGDRIEKCNKDFVSGNFELKFKGTPWTRVGARGAVQCRLIVLDLMQCLENQGYTMCTALDIDGGVGGAEYKSNGEAWFWYR
ncbi:hypothetical protein BDW72DRAFT_203756 [Aspergillus terricola var. indicus]